MRPAASAVVALFTVGCGSGGLSVDRDYDPDTDFTTFSTYAWSTESGDLSGSRIADEFTDVRIRRAIDAELARAGLERRETGDSALTVGYIARVSRQVERPTGDPRAADVDRVGGVYDSSPSDRWFEEGSLEIGLVDVRRQRVVWKGIGTAELAPAPDPAERERRIEQVVREILKDFPPR